MNLLSLAEKLAGEPQAPVAFDAARCLHSGDKFAGCDACVAICPSGAIAPGEPPEFAAVECVRCFACLPACPTGAYAMEDEVPDVMRCLARLDIDTLELVCQQHPAPHLGLEGRSAAIQVRGCLAGLGTAAYLQLATKPLQRVVLRTDACADCSWQTLPAEVLRQAAGARQWLQSLQRADFLEEAPVLQNPVKRPVHRAGSPPVSRRDLFRGRVQEPPPVDIVSSTNPYHQRLRLLNALRRFEPENLDRETAQTVGKGFAALTVSHACSACGTCARACPTGALVLETTHDERHFELTFSLQACLACDSCAHLCLEGALAVDHEVSLQRIYEAHDDEVLLEGALGKCKRCNGRFAEAALKDGYCSVCAFRRSNPFVSRMPATLASKTTSHQKVSGETK